MYACANVVFLSLNLQAAGKASHAPGNVNGTNRPRMPTTARSAKGGTALTCEDAMFAHPMTNPDGPDDSATDVPFCVGGSGLVNQPFTIVSYNKLLQSQRKT